MVLRRTVPVGVSFFSRKTIQRPHDSNETLDKSPAYATDFQERKRFSERAREFEVSKCIGVSAVDDHIFKGGYVSQIQDARLKKEALAMP